MGLLNILRSCWGGSIEILVWEVNPLKTLAAGIGLSSRVHGLLPNYLETVLVVAKRIDTKGDRH